MKFKTFFSLLIIIFFLIGCDIENNATDSKNDIITEKEAENILEDIGDAPVFTDDIFENEEALLTSLIELQNWTNLVITLNKEYRSADDKAIDVILSKLKKSYSLDVSNYYVNRYFKNEGNGYWGYLEQENVGLLRLINKDITVEVVKENEIIHVNVTGIISNDDLEVKSNYSFVKRNGQYQIIAVSNTTN